MSFQCSDSFLSFLGRNFLFNVILDIISFLLFPVSRMSQPAPMSPKFLLAISEFQGLNLDLWPISGSFVHCERQRSGLIFFMMIYSFPRHVYQKCHFFSSVDVFWTLVKTQLAANVWVPLWGFCSVLLVSMSVVMVTPHILVTVAL